MWGGKVGFWLQKINNPEFLQDDTLHCKIVNPCFLTGFPGAVILSAATCPGEVGKNLLSLCFAGRCFAEPALS
ncbi:MAG: hypothetical protein ACRD22_20365, partial [Terriglobia bacterium]